MSRFKTKEEFYTKHGSQIGDLSSKFEGYLVRVTQKRIKDYLCQFELEDKRTGLKLLQKIDYYSNEKISRLAKQLGGKLKRITNRRFDDVCFCPTDPSSGSSTDTIIRKLRNSMGMEHEKYDEKFIRVSDLGSLAPDPEVDIANIREQIDHIRNLSDDDISESERNSQIADLTDRMTVLQNNSGQSFPKTIVFVDDFIGSGRSFRGFWQRIGTFYNENHRYVLAALIAHQQGIDSITAETPIQVITTKPIPTQAKIFHNRNTTFTKNEKNILKKYCNGMGSKPADRYGFGDTQSLVVIYERISNNTLPILHAKTENWTPLFPRTI